MTPIEAAAEALRKGAGVTFPWAMSITPQMLMAALDAAEDDIRVALTDLYLHDDVTPDFVWGEIRRALLEGSDR